MNSNRSGTGKKLFVALSLLVLLTGLLVPASASWWYVKTPNGKTVNLRDYDTGEVIAQIPYGTRLYANEDSTELSAYVTYQGIGGFVKWAYLVREKPAPYQASKKTSSKPKTTEPPGVYGKGSRTVSVTGGVLQFPNKKGNAAGTKYSAVHFEEPTALVVTAVIPKGKKIDYWLVNQIKIRLSGKTLTLLAEDQDISVEIVFK